MPVKTAPKEETSAAGNGEDAPINLKKPSGSRRAGGANHEHEADNIPLEEELARTKAQLRSSSEQFQIQAEELRASNEELQAMNAELRSAAEELKTSKEELQSFNEELRTVAQEVKGKFSRIAIARETRMTDLKREVNDLAKRLGEKPPYKIESDES